MTFLPASLDIRSGINRKHIRNTDYRTSYLRRQSPNCLNKKNLTHLSAKIGDAPGMVVLGVWLVVRERPARRTDRRFLYIVAAAAAAPTHTAAVSTPGHTAVGGAAVDTCVGHVRAFDHLYPKDMGDFL